MNEVKFNNKPHLRWVTLFISSATLLCCALPVLLVSFGLGAVVASANYNIPGFMLLAEHQFWTLSLSAVMLIFLAWVIWRPNQLCPADPKLAAICQHSKHWNIVIFGLSILIWMIGFFFSVLLLPLRHLFNL